MLGKSLDTQARRIASRTSRLIRLLHTVTRLPGSHPLLLDYPVNPAPRYGYGKPLHRMLYDKLDRNSSEYRQTIKRFTAYGEGLRSISLDTPATPSDPYWKNGFIGGMDPVALYCFPCLLESGVYIEIGSGNSTKFVKKAIQQNSLRTRLISIDPHPRAEIDSLCDEVIRCPLEDLDTALFDDLGSGDILMVDNSHRCFQNSDVTVVFLEILPRLKPGVLIYIDDIYLPRDYPPEWASRYYSEQYLLAVLLLADVNRYTVVLPCQFIANNPDLIGEVNSFWDEISLPEARGYGNGFWMVVNQ